MRFFFRSEHKVSPAKLSNIESPPENPAVEGSKFDSFSHSTENKKRKIAPKETYTDQANNYRDRSKHLPKRELPKNDR